VEDGPFFCNVDLLAAEHRGDPAAQIRFVRQLDEKFYRFICDAVFE
jgi:hypothetical protein